MLGSQAGSRPHPPLDALTASVEPLGLPRPPWRLEPLEHIRWGAMLRPSSWPVVVGLSAKNPYFYACALNPRPP